MTGFDTPQQAGRAPVRPMRETPVAPLAARCRRGDGLGRFCDDLAKILRSFRKQTRWRAANVNGEALDDQS